MLPTVLLVLLVLAPPRANGITVTKIDRWHGRPATPITANLSREPYYKLLLGTVRAAAHEIDGSTEVWDRPALPRQRLGSPPPHWIPITLLGRGSERTQIAVRGDNLAFVGFTSSDGRWYELKPKEGESPVIPGSVVLDFDGSYGDLLGYDPKTQLGLLKLGNEEFLDAIGVLYRNPGVRREQELKTAVATVSVMVCEAARIIPIRRRLSSAWGHNPTTLPEAHVKYVAAWGSMCFRLLCETYSYKWTRYPDQASELDGMGITNATQALQVVDMILWPERFDLRSPQASCT